MSVLDRPAASPAAPTGPRSAPGDTGAAPRPRPPRRWPPLRWFARLDRFALGVAGAVAVAFALRLAIGLTDDAPASDETAYLDSGASLVAGDGFTRGDRPELHFPPLVPFVLGVAARVAGDAHAGSVAVTVLAGTAAVVPLALLARRVAGPALGPRAGVAAAWVAALTPGLATLPSTRGTGSEATYTLVVAVAVALGLAARDHRPAAAAGSDAGSDAATGTDAAAGSDAATGTDAGAGPPWRGTALTAAAGVAVGLAYLARPEGLLLALPLGLAVAWPVRRAASAGGGRAWRAAALAAAAFALPVGLCVVPYAAFLHQHTGTWELTAKTQDASIEAWDAVARGDRLARDRILYALDDSGLHFDAERAPLPELARDDPSGYAAIVGTNVSTLVTTAVGWSLVPLPVTALAGWAAFRRWRTTDRPVVAVLLAVGGLPVVSALAFFVQPRYLVATVAVVVVLAGVGLASLGGRARRPVLAGVLALLAVVSLTAFRGPEGWGRPADFTDQRRAGEWLAAHAGPDDLVVTRSMVVDFYAERPTLALPDGSLDEVLRFARYYGARWLVADEAHVSRFRPRLASLLTEEDVPGLRLVHEATAEGRTARVYALDPVPPPAPAGREGPALGFMGDGA